VTADNPSNVRYYGIWTVPRTEPPAGQVVVHNHVRPVDFHPETRCGRDGFRAWTQDADPSA
jgi:hypothetical protein